MYSKLEVLSEKMKSEKALLGDQLSPSSLQLALQEKRAELIIQEGEIVAFGALWQREQSLELGSMWVDFKYRGQGFGSLVFSRLVARVQTATRLFVITHNPLIIHLALKNDMHEASRADWMSAVPWSASCGPCDRLLEVDKISCPFRCVEKECRLFFRK